MLKINLKSSLSIGILIVFIAFLFSRIPLFLKLPIPCFWPDSYDYFYYLSLLNGNIENIKNLPIELPSGYPLFCYLVGLISDKTYIIIVLQNIIDLIANVYLIYIIHKYFPRQTIWVAIVLVFVMIDSQTILYDNSILTESIYKSTLLFFCGVFISTIRSNHILPKIGLSVCMVLLALMRSNGIYIYIFLPIVLIYLFINHAKWRQLLYLLVPFIIFNIAWAFLNLKTNGYFMFGNMGRITNTINHNKQSRSLHLKGSLLNFNSYVFGSQREREVLTYDIIAQNAIKLEERKANIHEKMFDGTKDVDENTKKLLFKEFYNKPVSEIAQSNFMIIPVCDASDWYGFKVFPKGIFFMYYYFSLNILSPIYSNFIWTILFFIVFGYSLYKLIKTKQADFFILVSLCLVHLFSIMAISVSIPGVSYRFEYVSSFIIFLVGALSPILISYNIRFLKK